MDAKELADLVARVRRLFRGEMDEELFALARRYMARIHHGDAVEALEAYALDYGGATGRFLPARFREFVDRARAARLDRERLHARLTETAMNQTMTDTEWRTMRTTIRVAERDAVERAIGELVASGWDRPPAPIDEWPRSWVVAVSDIVSGRNIDGAPAVHWWRRMVPPRRLVRREPAAVGAAGHGVTV